MLVYLNVQRMVKSMCIYVYYSRIGLIDAGQGCFLGRIFIGIGIYEIFCGVFILVRRWRFQEAHLLFQARFPAKIWQLKAGIW